jgi:hypothetical protein
LPPRLERASVRRVHNTGEGDERPGERAGVTAVVLLGALAPLRLFPEPGVLRSFDPRAEGADPAQLVDLVAEDLAANGTVLALHPTWDGGTGDYLARMVRSALDTSRVVPLATPLPPLAIAVLGAQLAAVAALLPAPGRLVAGAELLGSRLVVGAWTSSVSRLERPAPSLGQHLWSWWPPSRFAVAFQPDARVDRIRRRRPFDAGSWAIPSPSLAVLATHGGNPSWLHEVVVPAIGAERVVEAGPSPLGQRWWGAPRLVEVVGCPAEATATASELVAAFPCSPCGWCGEPISGSSCPFCWMAPTPLPNVRSVA